MLKHAVAAALALSFIGAAHAGKTLDAIKQRGQLVCGVNPSLPGFSAADSQGNWAGLDVDVCKALAATVLNDASKIKWVPLNASQRFAALQSGEIDILSRNTTWTLTRDASLGLFFTGTTYYDGQGFMVTKKSKITSAKQLKGATVCVQSGTTTEKNLNDYSKAAGLNMKPVVFETQEATNKAYFAGRCQAYTTDASGLASVRNKEAGNPEDHVILPELISKEPLGPAVRRGDDEFFTIAKWVVFALIEAEEYGITQANVDEMVKEQQGPGGAAHPRHVGGHRQAARPRQGLGLPRHQGHRQLRRDLRAQRRPEVGAEAAARRQQPVEQGRLHVRPAGAVTNHKDRVRRGRTRLRFCSWQHLLRRAAGPGAARPFGACCTRWWCWR